MNDKPIDHEQSVSEIVGDVDLPSFVERNLLKALNKLATSAIGLISGAIDRHESENWSETSSRNRIREQVARQISENLKVPPAYADAAARKFASRIVKEQLNRDAILQFAAGQVSSKTPANECNVEDRGEIGDDFLDAFDDVSKSKSTEYMQRLFGRILAGEIEAPGSFSIRSLKTVEQLDQGIAKLFQRLCSMCTVLEIGGAEQPKTLLDVRVPSLGGNAGMNALREYGLAFANLNRLNEYGLIIPDFNSWYDYRICVADERNTVVAAFRHQGGDWGLIPTKQHSGELRLSGVELSLVGKELFPIVDQVASIEYTAALRKFFTDQNLSMVPAEVASNSNVIQSGQGKRE